MGANGFEQFNFQLIPAYYMNATGTMADVRRSPPMTLAMDSHIRNLRTQFDRCVR